MSSRNAVTEASAARAPGASITRRRKPADARGGPASDEAAQPSAPAAPPPRILQSRVDALELGFRGDLAKSVREMLGSALAQAKELRLSSIAVTLGPHEFALSARSREGWWYLENRDAAVTIDEGPYLDGWAVGVQLRAMTLAAQSPADSAALAGDIASHVVNVIIEQRVRRIDLCADLAGFGLGRIDARQWVACGRAKARKLSPSPDDQMVEYFDGGKPVAFYVGKSAIVLRAYDKTVELQNDLVGEKRSAEHARWKLAGWNGTEPVDRVEFQVRGDAIKELDDGQLRDPDRFAARLDALWKHLRYKCVLRSP